MLLKILLAIIAIESNGDISAVGDNGAAVGWLQIQPIMVEDVNRIVGMNRYAVYDRLDPIKSAEIFQIYVKHYASSHRLGRQATVRDISLMWNGGPNFYRYPHTADASEYMRKLDPHLMKLGISQLEAVNSFEFSAADWARIKAMY